MRCVPLNPCDYLYYAQHDLLQRRGLLGNPILMVLDLAGHIDAARLDAALRRAFALHPTLAARLRIARLTGRPYWQTDGAPPAPSIRFHPPADEATIAAAVEKCFVRPLDMAVAPQVHVDVFPGNADHTRVCMTWPHALMDAEGGQWFVHEVDRMDRAPDSKLPGGLCDHAARIDPLAGMGLLRRINWARRGLKRYRSIDAAESPLAETPTAAPRWRVHHRRWPASTLQEINDRALFWCPTGTGRFGRYLAGCVLRALRRLYLERRRDAGALLITLPQKPRDMPAARPLTGNFLISATLVGRRSVLDDKRALMEALTVQIESFRANRDDLANAALIWLAGLQRAWQYRRTLAHPSRGFQPYASGFSYYGEIDPPVRTFLGTRVENFWGITTMPVPPGWNPAFARFDDSLNFMLAWLDGCIARDTAARFADLIESELLDADG